MPCFAFDDMENRDGSEVAAADAGLPRSRVCVAAVWRDTRTKVLKGYRPEQLRRSLAFGLLAAYHSYVFLAAALSIIILSGNLILAWFISWFQEVRNGDGALDPGKVSLGYYLAVLLRCWLLIHLSAELLRCTIWLVEDCWEVQTFQTYRRICTGAAFRKMREAQPEPAVAKQLSCSDWAHGSSWQWWVDLPIQALIYATIDVVPLVFAVPSLFRLDLVSFLSSLFATACSAGVVHVVILYAAWTLSDVAAKVVAWNALPISDMSDIRPPPSPEVLPESQADEPPEDEDPLRPANFCALCGGVLHLGWVMILKALFFAALVVFAIQRDMADENPFWLVAALLLGVAFWHSIFAQGLELLAGRLEMSSSRSCLPCCGADEEAQTLSGEGDARFLCVPVQLAAKLQVWGAAHAGLSAAALAGQYELAVYALLLQLTLFGNFRWVEGAIFILLLILLLLFRRATLLRLGNWCAFFGLLESTFFVILAVAINAAYSGSAGGAVLVMALLLQCTLTRDELRAWRIWRAVTLGLHCSLVGVVALCMWSMQGGSGWTEAQPRGVSTYTTYPWCDLQWPLGRQGSDRYLTVTNFADICAMTNLPGSDFNATLESQFPGWTLVFERRAGKSLSDKGRDGYYDWTTFFELADPQNESTLFAVRGTQSPLEVLQDVNIFTPVVLTQIAAFFGPDLTSSVTKTVFSLFAGLPSIDKDFFQAFLAHVRARVRSDPSRRYYLTGHSLGGGLAKLVALEVGQPSVTFAAPGLRYTSQMLLSKETQAIYNGNELLEAGEHLSTVVVPEHDLVSRIDQQLGAQLGVACVITWRLFNHLKLRLLERPWITEVHKLRVSQLLNDDAAADAIAAELRTYGCSLAGTPGTVQLRTGQTMWNFYQQNLRELPECLAKMQDRGVPVDAATLARLEDISSKDLETKTNLLRETLKSIRKPDGSLLCEDASAININSSQQLQTLLFGGARNKFNSFETLQVTRCFHSAEAHWLAIACARLREEACRQVRLFFIVAAGSVPDLQQKEHCLGLTFVSLLLQKPWPSFAVVEREQYQVKRQLAEAGFNEEAVGNVWVEAALGYLSDCKRIETNARMLKALQKAVVKDRIHPSWQFATSTGRLTCSQPNLHSLVAGTKDIYGVRAAFKAQPGHKLVLADYSQLELRILAHISQCRIMSQGLHQGGDYHAQVAVEMFDHVREAVEKDGVTVDNSGAQTVRHSAQESADRQGLVLRCLPIPLAIMGIMDLTVGDLTPEKGEKKCCCCCCSCFGFVIFILFVTSFQQVNRLHAGLLRNGLTGEVGLERAYLQGRYFVGFWNEFVHFPTTLNTIEFADEAVEEGVQQLGKLRSRDKDGKQIWLDVSVQYRIYPEELPQIYREMTKVYEDVYISELRGALQQVTNEFAIDQAWRDYPSVQKKMHDVCKAVLLQRHAECWGLQLWGIRLQVEYENQLIRTQVRKQAEETARATQLQTEYRQKTEVILAEYAPALTMPDGASRTIINQKGVADKNRIERDSVSAAQSALVTAQGEVLKIVQDEVKLNATEWMPERIMTPEQLVQYQRILMLKNKKSANFAVKSIGQSQSVSTSHHDTALCVLAVPCVRGPRRILSGYRMLPRNVPESAFPEERNRAKAVNFGIIYGMTSSRLAEDLDIPKEEATALMQAWYKNKPMVQSWKKRVEEHAQQEQVSLSLLGRERHLPLLDDQASAFYREKSKRAAVNFAIQGSAADVVTAVMLQLENCQELKQMGYHMIMQVHDEIILDGPEEHAEKAAEILREIMMKPFKEIQQNYEFRVPLEVNIAIGDTLQAKA
ncbi:unnamed protein product [Symbiodinium necroappetens]|uniref:DNA-directed DNA polymerase family A palm domain-containing protein n=1 Tax=Symbiodinium necroappetens TaxID=1628268 RepID=A0A812KUN1_9DINO|nr:unnamed protein product [Symbiodinium necroappetens]